MPIIEPVIRPPSEANSFLLQITTGCSANSCSFCPSYHGKKFGIKDQNEIFSDIDEFSNYYPDTSKVFLMDGDALVLSFEKLKPVLEYLNKKFPRLNRISSYANDYNILSKSDDDLKNFYDYRLRLIYMGLESGSQKILSQCCKKSTVEGMIKAVLKAKEFKIKSSVIVLLGLGGIELTVEHIEETAKVLNIMQPDYLSFLSLIIIKGTEIYKKVINKEFHELNKLEILNEMHEIIKRLELNKTVFFSNHASNFLPLTGRFPYDKEELLQIISDALLGKVELRDDFYRGL